FLVSPVVASKWSAAVPLMPPGLGFAEHFMPHGRAPHVAELFASPDQARTLTTIATTRGEAFYRGELAEAMVAHANTNGALHAREDFAGHTIDWVTPLALPYGEAEVHE